MGVRNFLIAGVSCSGKTAVLKKLRLRGHRVVDDDNELAYFDDNRNWIWDIEKVSTLVADQSAPVTFFCGASRNSEEFVSLFDGVFILDIDLETVNQRLAARRKTEWGGTDNFYHVRWKSADALRAVPRAIPYGIFPLCPTFRFAR